MRGPAQEGGFTLLEVMIAVAMLAIAFTTLLSSQNQSVSLARQARFETTAALLAQAKMAEFEVENEDFPVGGSGDFGEDFPGFRWEADVSEVGLAGIENVQDYLEQVDLTVTWGEQGRYRYTLRLYRYEKAR